MKLVKIKGEPELMGSKTLVVMMGGWGWTEKVGNPQNGHGGEEKKVDEDRKTKAVVRSEEDDRGGLGRREDQRRTSWLV